MPFPWIYLGMWLASMVVGELLRPKIKVDNAKPAGVSDFDFPTATEDRRKAYVFGTVELNSPNVTWWGDLTSLPIKKKAGKGGFMGTGRTIWQTVGYRYYAGMKLSLCLGPVELLELKADGKSFWMGQSSGGLIPIDGEGLFGGEDSGGGLGGTINFLPGSSTQAVDSYLQAMLGSPLPAWRGVATLVWRGPSSGGGNGYLGTSPRIAPISAVVRRTPSNLGQSVAITNLAGDANPAEVIYEILTSSECGMSQPAALVDVAGFQAIAQQLAAEGFGISGVWDSDNTSARTFIDDILRTIDGVCYLDFATGKWTLALARGGYDLATLPVLDQTVITALEGYSETALDETANQVQISYTRRNSNFESKQVQAQAFANIRYQDAVVNQAISYPMISNETLAARVADRDLRAISTSLAKGDLICNRKARGLKPGGLFKLAWAPQGLDQVVCRVLRVTLGDLTNRAIRVSFVRDVFSLGTALYGAPAPSGWVDPVQAPAPCPAQLVTEAPYHLTRQDGAKLLVMGQRPNGSCQAYEIWAKQTAPVADADYSYRGTGLAFAPVGVLTQVYGVTSAVDESGTLIVSGGSDFAGVVSVLNAELRLGANLVCFESGEWAAVRQITDNLDGTWSLRGIWRGVLDSVVQAHAMGERLWFAAYGQATTDETWAVGDALTVRLLPSGFRGVLPIAGASDALLTISGRAAKPYPPALMRIQGVDTLVTSVGDLVATWRHRDRLSQVGVVPQDDPSTAAPEGTYTIKAYVGGVLVRTLATGSTSDTATYTAVMRLADGTDGTQPVEIGVQTSTVNGASAEARTDAVVTTGLGMTLGQYLGGVQS